MAGPATGSVGPSFLAAALCLDCGMPWKDTVNSVLTRTTGYQLARDTAHARAEIAQEIEAKQAERIAALEEKHQAELRARDAERIRTRERDRRVAAAERRAGAAGSGQEVLAAAAAHVEERVAGEVVTCTDEETDAPDGAPIALLHLTTTTYAATTSALELFDRLSAGGVLVVADSGDAGRAVAEWAAARSLFLVPTAAGLVVVKPAE